MADTAKVNPVQIEKFLGGLEYPATKKEITEHAKSRGADENAINALNKIPNREYDGPSSISKELGRIQ